MDETRNGGSFPFPILGKNKDRNEKSLQHGVYLMAPEHRTGKGATKHTPIVSFNGVLKYQALRNRYG